jgi:hypothetical protein
MKIMESQSEPQEWSQTICTLGMLVLQSGFHNKVVGELQA